MTNRRLTLMALPMMIVAFAASGCGGSGASSPLTDQTPSPDATSAATGDIPGNQVFLLPQPKGRLLDLLPEGWTQKGKAKEVTFTDKWNSVHVAVARRDRRQASATANRASPGRSGDNGPRSLLRLYGPDLQDTYGINPATGGGAGRPTSRPRWRCGRCGVCRSGRCSARADPLILRSSGVHIRSLLDAV